MSKLVAQALLQGKEIGNGSNVYDQLVMENADDNQRPAFYLLIFDAITQQILDRAKLALALMRNIHQQYHLLFLGWIFQYQKDLINQYIRYTDIHGHTYQVAALEYTLRKIRQNNNLSSAQKEGYSKLIRSLFIGAGVDMQQLVQKPLQTATNGILFSQGQTLAQLYPPEQWSDRINQINCSLLDEPEMCVGKVEFEKLIRQRAQQILIQQARGKSRISLRPYLHYALHWYNWTAVHYFLQQGLVLNFSRLSEFLGRMDQLQQKKDPVSRYLYTSARRILRGLIDSGTHVDASQLNLITQFDSNLATTLTTAYQRPLWKKVCSLEDHTNPGRVPPSLFKLLIELDMYNSQNIDNLPQVSLVEVCQNLEQLDPEELRQQIVDYNRRYLNEEFCSLCSNSEQLIVDPLTQNDLLASAYRNGQGSVMCYPADMFPKMLETKTDPITGDRLPSEYLADIRGKNSQLIKLGIVPPQAKELTLPALGGVHQGLAELTINAKINDQISEQIQAIFQELWSAQFGVDAELPQWTPAKLEYLQELAQLDLKPLLNSSHSAAEALIYRSAQYIIIKFISTHPKQAQQTLQRLKNLSNTKSKPFEQSGLFQNFV